MKLFELKPRKDLKENNNPWKPYYDRCFGMIVRASSEEKARKIAQYNAGAETMKFNNPWINPEYSTCVELTNKGEEKLIIKNVEKY